MARQRESDEKYNDAAVASIMNGLRRSGTADTVLGLMSEDERREVDRAVVRHNDRVQSR
jgi:hypothetical protein